LGDVASNIRLALMSGLLAAARVPVLTDIVLGIPGGGSEVEMYPFPIPDLFVVGCCKLKPAEPRIESA